MINNYKPTYIPICLESKEGCGIDCVNDCARYKSECPGCPTREMIEPEDVEIKTPS